MIQIKYLISSLKIHEIEMAKETKTRYVSVNGYKYSKQHYRFHDTFEEAKADLIVILERHYEIALERVSEYKSQLESAKKLTRENIRKVKS